MDRRSRESPISVEAGPCAGPVSLGSTYFLETPIVPIFFSLNFLALHALTVA